MVDCLPAGCRSSHVQRTFCKSARNLAGRPELVLHTKFQTLPKHRGFTMLLCWLYDDREYGSTVCRFHSNEQFYAHAKATPVHDACDLEASK
jgi:hypothetical protein